MLWRLIGISLISTIVVVLSLLPTHSDAYITRSTGCYHNGTWYADKSVIPTIEKCLNCQCNRKTLVCRRKVCPEMPMPPPRGCVVVQKKNTCCPYLSCARLESFYKIPVTRRIIAYLDHYERESIDRVVNDNMLQRRSDDADTDLHVCVKNGTVYKSGSAMSSSNLCSYCYCIGGHEKCVKPKCMLPVEGCKPIFVDSTCCPVRYDCSSKSSGKSSQEVRYRKTANKHFLRMSQRLQRNRGCTVGSTFYAEGQKMKSDPDKPCDICFCIRGSRRCAPKKCAPALKNCIPVVPKGQCCPSSYDCGSQRDYRRAQNSRQFNLFSLLFGKDEETESNTEIPVQYPHDRHPEITDPNINKFPQLTLMASSEKSIFDTLREGLEFIDANNKQMLAENSDLLAEPSTVAEVPLLANSTTMAPETREGSSSSSSSTTTEISFLDLLLGPSESNKQQEEPEKESEEESDTAVTETGGSTTGSSLSWVDLLLGPDEDEEKLPAKTTTTPRPTASTTTTKRSTTTTVKPSTTTAPSSTTIAPTIKRIDNDLEEDFLSSGELSVGELPAEAQQQLLKNQQKPPAPTKTTSTTRRPTQQTTRATSTTTTTKTPTKKTTRRATTTTAATRRPTTKKSTTSTTRKPAQRTTPKPTQATDTKSPVTSSPSTTIKPQSGLLSALFDMLSSESLGNKPNATNALKTTTTKPRTRPTPLFKPLPSIKPLVRINSKIANLTVQPPPMVSTTKMAQNSTAKPSVAALGKTPQPLSSTTTTHKTPTRLTSTTPTPTTRRSTTSSSSSSSTSTTSTTTTTTSTTTTKTPIVVKTNPSILEVDPIDAEPTLPPSLPNLKIIPFLPTDAVNADLRPQPAYDYYNGNGNANVNNPQHNPISRIDFDLYDDNPNAYASITETFPYYADLEDGSKAEYIYKFNVEAPVAVAVKPAVATVDSVPTNAYVSYNAAAVPANQGVMGSVESVPQTNGGFSPPTKTEGGFVPKTPLLPDENSPDALAKAEAENNYHATQHIIDITTSEPMANTTKVIEFTTPDPFKDVIHTEPPPNLFSLIEDKEKIMVSSKEQPASINVTSNLNIADLEQQMLLPAIELNTTAPQKIVSIPIPPTTKQKNTIESFLDFLLSDEEPEVESLNAPLPSTVPPFKTLPTVKTPATTDKVEAIPITTTTATMWMTSKVTNEITQSSSSTKPTTTTTTTIVSKATSKPTRTKTTAPSATASRNKTKTKTNNRQPTKSQPATGSSAQKRPKPNNQRRVIAKPTSTTTTVTTIQTPATTTKPIEQAGNQQQEQMHSSPAAMSNTKNPYLMSPFDKLPFMDTSYEVNHKPLRPHLGSAPESYNFWENQFLNAGDSGNGDVSAVALPFMRPTAASTTTTTTTTTTTPRPYQSSSNSLMDPAGILKLAGCNIYGRMYRVGRIILELSSACLECRCTEVGVKCQQLDC